MCEISFNWPLILQYITVFFSWPVVVLVIVIYFTQKFSDSISIWIRNLKVQYGDATISSSQAIDSKVDSAEGDGLPQKQADAKDGKSQYLSTIQTTDVEVLKKQIVSWRENAYIWEYKYLNYYLVPNTKRVLHWLYLFKTANFETYNNVFSSSIPEMEERNTILMVLQNHFLLVFKDGILEISEKGKEYTEVMILPIFKKDGEDA